jgi:hypothetical protein
MKLDWYRNSNAFLDIPRLPFERKRVSTTVPNLVSCKWSDLIQKHASTLPHPAYELEEFKDSFEYIDMTCLSLFSVLD